MCSALATCLLPWNITCSNRWAKPGLARLLVLGADVVPDVDRDDRREVVLGDDQAQAVGEALVGEGDGRDGQGAVGTRGSWGVGPGRDVGTSAVDRTASDRSGPAGLSPRSGPGEADDPQLDLDLLGRSEERAEDQRPAEVHPAGLGADEVLASDRYEVELCEEAAPPSLRVALLWRRRRLGSAPARDLIRANRVTRCSGVRRGGRIRVRNPAHPSLAPGTHLLSAPDPRVPVSSPASSRQQRNCALDVLDRPRDVNHQTVAGPERDVELRAGRPPDFPAADLTVTPTPPSGGVLSPIPPPPAADPP